MFKNTNDLVFMGIDSRVSKSNNPFRLARIGDPVAMQNFEFFVGDSVTINAQPGETVVVELNLDTQGYNVVPRLVSIVKKEK